MKIISPQFSPKHFSLVLLFLVCLTICSCAQEIHQNAADTELAMEHYSLGMFYEEMDDDSSAAAEFRKALEYDPENAGIHAELSFVLAKLHSFDEAEKHAEKAIEGGAEDTDLYIILGNGAKERGEVGRAISYYRKAVTDTTNYFLVLNLAQLLRENDEYTEAIALLNALKARFPFDLRVHTQLGDLYGRMEKFDLAASEFRDALLIDSLYYPAILGLGIIFEINGQVDSSLWYYEKAVQLNPQNMSLLKRIVEFEIMRGEWNDAKEHALSVLAATPTEHTVRKQLAYAYYRLSLLHEALEQYMLLSALIPDDVTIFHFLGRIYYEQGELKEAKQALIASQEINTEFIPNYEYLFLISIKEMDETGGRSYFNAMKDRKLQEEEIYFTTGNHLYREQEYELSKTFFLKSINARKDFAPAWYSLGFAYEKLGNIDSSEIALRKVMEFDPANANTMNALGYLFVERGIKLDEAQRLIEQALEIDALNGYYIDSLGWLYYMRGDFKKAKELLLKASNVVEDAVIYDHLGDVHKKLGEDEQAYEMWIKALELDPGNEDITEKINRYIREHTPGK